MELTTRFNIKKFLSSINCIYTLNHETIDIQLKSRDEIISSIIFETRFLNRSNFQFVKNMLISINEKELQILLDNNNILEYYINYEKETTIINSKKGEVVRINYIESNYNTFIIDNNDNIIICSLVDINIKDELVRANNDILKSLLDILEREMN